MKTTKSTNRRNFLLAAGLGSAGAVAAVVTAGGTAKPAATAESASDPKSTSYRASAHVLKYYKTTEV
ncbi:MAG: hypothetical protein ABI789_08755 [Usitatibacter sp.]